MGANNPGGVESVKLPSKMRMAVMLTVTAMNLKKRRRRRSIIEAMVQPDRQMLPSKVAITVT